VNAHDASRVIREKIGTHAGAIDVAEVGNAPERACGQAANRRSVKKLLDAALQEFAVEFQAPSMLAAVRGPPPWGEDHVQINHDGEAGNCVRPGTRMAPVSHDRGGPGRRLRTSS